MSRCAREQPAMPASARGATSTARWSFPVAAMPRRCLRSPKRCACRSSGAPNSSRCCSRRCASTRAALPTIDSPSWWRSAARAGCSRASIISLPTRKGLAMPVIRTLLIAAALLVSLSVQAQESARIRLGTLAPRGTSWHRSLLEMGEKWRAVQGAGSAFIVYTDGSQGGETDMVRRMRVGQLNAALLSVVGLSEIDDSASVLQKMPMVFRSWDELDFLREKLRPRLEQRFFDKGFVVLFWGDAGWVRFFSKEAALHPADYRRMKVFTWAGDNPQADIMQALGYQPVVLEISDILPGLPTGMLNLVPS